MDDNTALVCVAAIIFLGFLGFVCLLIKSDR